MITLPRATLPEPAIERVKLGRDGAVAWIAPHGRWVTRHISRLTPADLDQMPDGSIAMIRSALLRGVEWRP